MNYIMIMSSSSRRVVVSNNTFSPGIVPPSDDSARKTNFIMIENSDLKPKKWVSPMYM